MSKHLDRNLYIGGEVKEVYDELIKTLSEDHLLFDLVIILTKNYLKKVYIFYSLRMIMCKKYHLR
jgi:hypothetical protein